MAIEPYLKQLEDESEEQLIKILTQQDTNGWSIGMAIVRWRDTTTTQKYLQLLENAFKNEKLTSKQLTTILMQQNEKGWSVGMSITTMKNGAIIRQYLQLLENMLENGKLTSEQFTTILTQEDKDDVSVETLLIYQDTKQYEILKNINLFMKTTEKFSSLLEFKKAIKQL